jgi:cyanuric acid amidohydrolase
MAMPNDTSELQALIDSGKVEPESIVALVGKTEGTGFHDDMGRVLADGALRGWVAGQLGIDVSEVAERVTFVLSGAPPISA